MSIKYKEKIKQGLKDGLITHEGTNVKFEDGHIIGGVSAESQEKLINIIEKCLYRGDFSIPTCLQ